MGRLVVGVNDLQTWCEQNGEWGQRLMEEWVGLDEEDNCISMSAISKGANKKVKWKCSKCGHEWYATAMHRTYNKSGCPNCIGRKNNNKNVITLKEWCEQNGEWGQKLLKEWNQEMNRNTLGVKIGVEDIAAGSNKNAWWKCEECGNEWQYMVYYRTHKKVGCPICRGSRVGEANRKRQLNKGNSLKEWCEKNGEWGRRLLAEWDYDENNKIGFTPENITYGSREVVSWICKNCGEHFEMMVELRTYQFSKCTHCADNSTSYPEQFIFQSLKQITSAINRKKLFNNIEYDIVLSELKVCIEYNGMFWHIDKDEHDNWKKQKCLENEYKYIKIEDKGVGENIYYSDELIILPNKGRANNYRHLKEIVVYIAELLSLNSNNIDFVKADEDAWEILNKKEDTVDRLYPMLVREWADERTMKYYTPSCYFKFNWKCSNCNCEWESSLADRIRLKSSCTHCGYNVFDNKIHVHAIRKKIG